MSLLYHYLLGSLQKEKNIYKNLKINKSLFVSKMEQIIFAKQKGKKKSLTKIL